MNPDLDKKLRSAGVAAVTPVAWLVAFSKIPTRRNFKLFQVQVSRPVLLGVALFNGINACPNKMIRFTLRGIEKVKNFYFT